MTENPYIEYNMSNKDFARYNRKNMTSAEKKIWANVLRKKQAGYIFLRQKMLGSFIVDFYCSKLLLVIEIDGDSHDNRVVYDINRTDIINELGVSIIRYTNSEVLNHIEQVAEDLQLKIKDREKHINENYTK